MVASDFDGLGGYRTLEYEGQVPTKPCNCCFSRVFQASVCIATYGMSVPSLHTVYRLCDIYVPYKTLADIEIGTFAMLHGFNHTYTIRKSSSA